MVVRWDSLLDNINNMEVTVGWKLDPTILVHGGAIHCRCLGEGETLGLCDVFDVWGLGNSMPGD